MNASDIISHLKLEPHIEGGYFRRTFAADHRAPVATPHGPRFTLTSIYYLLTSDSPVGHFHCNRSDIIHCHHVGDATTFHLIHPNGVYSRHVVGANLVNGEEPQLAVPGGTWKASNLAEGSHGYALISEVVAPGFDFDDMQLGNVALLSQTFPEHKLLFDRFARA